MIGTAQGEPIQRQTVDPRRATTRVSDKMAGRKGRAMRRVGLSNTRAGGGKRRAASSSSSGYSGTPLPKKLGIKPNSTVTLVEAPGDFAATLGDLPEGVSLRDGGKACADLTMWFVRSCNELRRGVGAFSRRSAQSPIWIAWPKKSSGVATGLSESDVRGAGLAAGWVDYKVCAIDATWSGLLFSRRKRQRAQR